MNTKKNPNADLESKRSLFFLIGLTFVLLIAIFALQWTTPYSVPTISASMDLHDKAIADIPITVRVAPEVPEREKAAEKGKSPAYKPVNNIIKKIVLDIPEPNDGPDNPDDDSLHIITRDELDNVEPETIPHFLVEKPAVPYSCVDAGDAEEQMQCLNEWLGNFIRREANPPVVMGDIRLRDKTYVNFIIDEHGDIVDIEARGGEHEEVAREAERVLSLVPNFRPASQMGRPVRMSMTIPVIFK